MVVISTAVKSRCSVSESMGTLFRASDVRSSRFSARIGYPESDARATTPRRASRVVLSVFQAGG